MRSEDREALSKYLLHTAPVQWVFWSMNARNKASKDSLTALLFDSEPEPHLKDLTRDDVKRNVIRCVLADPDLSAQILPEAKKFLTALEDEIVKRLTSPNPKTA